MHINKMYCSVGLCLLTLHSGHLCVSESCRTSVVSTLQPHAVFWVTGPSVAPSMVHELGPCSLSLHRRGKALCAYTLMLIFLTLHLRKFTQRPCAWIMVLEMTGCSLCLLQGSSNDNTQILMWELDYDVSLSKNSRNTCVLILSSFWNLTHQNVLVLCVVGELTHQGTWSYF